MSYWHSRITPSHLFPNNSTDSGTQCSGDLGGVFGEEMKETRNELLKGHSPQVTLHTFPIYAFSFAETLMIAHNI